MAFHQRSVSLPSKSLTKEAEVEAELQSLEDAASPPSSSSSSSTVAAVRDGLTRLGDVYGHIEEIVHLPSNQACTVQQQRKELDAEMERSLDLIDLCNATQESLAELKAAVQDLLAGLRRRDDASVQAKVQSYVRLAKNARKQLRKAGRRAAAASGREERECSLVIRLLLRARLVAASLLGSALQCLAGVAKQVVTLTPRRSLVSKALQRRSKAVVCEEGQPARCWRWSASSLESLSVERSFCSGGWSRPESPSSTSLARRSSSSSCVARVLRLASAF
ncbi:hypothetical protein ZEAMMB73_Zm00001d032003 [Zea mays]|jgi:hypothetical protein|uniref:Uncharacterized protein n=1 Tax=Zea mays TaxID=4577 RepID=B6U6K4_MAIZE|nr:hypothetical protein [Zea mays]ONM04194.1 hypothetical protein ZEAMMB73_Zm00001d032003 [Zea mays]|eukprot:XP_020398935.1 uncharacterized protein LOC103643215 [Zea mays]